MYEEYEIIQSDEIESYAEEWAYIQSMKYGFMENIPAYTLDELKEIDNMIRTAINERSFDVYEEDMNVWQ